MSLTEATHAGAFILSEANGSFSRDNGTLISGQDLAAGSVLGKITASGKYTMVAPGASDGSQTAAAVLYDAVDASAADAPCVVVNAVAEVNGNVLNWASLTAPQIATAKGQLASAGIKVR